MSHSNGTRMAEEKRALLKEFYGRTVQRTEDMRYSACCVDDSSVRFREILDLIPEEVKARRFGCGSPIPQDDLSSLVVVDFGCGAGADAFVLSKLVGPHGRVIGLDMTDEQLQVAVRNVSPVMKKFGYAEANVDFRKDYIESADTIPAGSVDLVISNCVINLSPLKDQVFRSIWRILRPSGEFYISDIVCDRRLPAEIRRDSRLFGECLAGAEYYNDLKDIMGLAGFQDVRDVSKRELRDRVGTESARFCSMTLRGFKIPDLDRRCENYGQFAEYLGNCAEQPVEFPLDSGHVFERGRPISVCRNTALMLSRTRLGRYFNVSPARKHFGLFDCRPQPVSSGPREGSSTSCCP